MSVDLFVVNTPVRLPTGYGLDSSSSHFHVGTLYNDAATGIISVENRVSLGASERVLGKDSFEQCIWEKVRVEISHINSDTGIFVFDQFRLDCDNKHQEQSFFGVGAQHHNARA